MTQCLQSLEQALDSFVAPDAPADLASAMRYGVLEGGKRLRGLLVQAAYQAVRSVEDTSLTTGASVSQATAVRAACAVELIHAYSLIHDDMPCMDNDVLRRGKPTVHVQFGEAAALLSGDAMQALAFEILTPSAQELAIPFSVQARLCALLARASGPAGMAGGQAIDLAHVGKPMTQEALKHMHELKTGALLRASVMMGAHCVPEVPAKILDALDHYGQAMGLAFQVVDDILDTTTDSATLGKTAGKDAADNKPTYVSLMGVDAAQAYAAELLTQALQALDSASLPSGADQALRGLAYLVVKRSH